MRRGIKLSKCPLPHAGYEPKGYACARVVLFLLIFVQCVITHTEPIDVRNAYMQAELKKSIYGLSDAPEDWEGIVRTQQSWFSVSKAVRGPKNHEAVGRHKARCVATGHQIGGTSSSSQAFTGYNHEWWWIQLTLPQKNQYVKNAKKWGRLGVRAARIEKQRDILEALQKRDRLYRLWKLKTKWSNFGEVVRCFRLRHIKRVFGIFVNLFEFFPLLLDVVWHVYKNKN